MKRLQNKNAVITGASDGIGLGIARLFAENGANVVLVARNKEKLEKAKAEIVRFGTEVQAVSADLSVSMEIQPVSEHILSLFPSVHILVNNAGMGRFFQFSETDEATLDAHLNLNVKAPYLLAQQLLPSLMENKGNIINISSYFANRMLQGRTTTAYSLTKGAVNSFTKSLAFELGPIGVRVNSIALGSTETPLLDRNLQNLPEDKRLEFSQMVKNIYPLGKIGTAEDIAQAATFLASDQAKWITGAILNVDGGLTVN